jgi:hypothetical protein
MNFLRFWLATTVLWFAVFIPLYLHFNKGCPEECLLEGRRQMIDEIIKLNNPNIYIIGDRVVDLEGAIKIYGMEGEDNVAREISE